MLLSQLVVFNVVADLSCIHWTVGRIISPEIENVSNCQTLLRLITL